MDLCKSRYAGVAHPNGFAGSMEKTAELLDVETTSTVLMLVPPLAGRRGSARTVGPQGCLWEVVVKVLLTYRDGL